jgi:hypothetical protein
LTAQSAFDDHRVFLARPFLQELKCIYRDLKCNFASDRVERGGGCVAERVVRPLERRQQHPGRVPRAAAAPARRQQSHRAAQEQAGRRHPLRVSTIFNQQIRASKSGKSFHSTLKYNQLEI